MYSQAEEDSVLAKLLYLHRLDRPGHFVEIGVGAGVENNTRALAERGWRGLWLGDEPLLWQPAGVIFHQVTVTPENVKDLTLLAPPVVDVLSLDIDGNDYWVGRVVIPYLLPRIVIVEYNHTYQGVDAIMPYTPNYRWHQGQPCGASLDAWRALLEPLGYQLAYTTFKQVNAFFVRQFRLRRRSGMHDALEEALQVLESLRTRVASNESRPSAEQICVELTQVMVLIGESRANQARQVPYQMDAPTIDKIEAAINAGHRISIETDGRVMVTSSDSLLAEVPIPAVEEPIPAVLPPDEPVLSSAGVLRSDTSSGVDDAHVEEGQAAGSGDASGGRPPDADPSR